MSPAASCEGGRFHGSLENPDATNFGALRISPLRFVDLMTAVIRRERDKTATDGDFQVSLVINTVYSWVTDVAEFVGYL